MNACLLITHKSIFICDKLLARRFPNTNESSNCTEYGKFESEKKYFDTCSFKTVFIFNK